MIRDTAVLIGELSALFLGVSFAISLTQRRLGDDRLRAWMGGRPVLAALKGVGVGFITPFCTYSAIPVLVGFRQAGVPPAGYVAFIVAAPVLDPILFGALLLIVGVQAAVVYAAVAFAAAMALALVAEQVGIERHLRPLPTAVVSRTIAAMPGTGASVRHLDPGTSDDPSDEPTWRGLRLEAPIAARAAIGLLRDLAPLLLIGVAVGVAITALVSPAMTVSITDAAGPLAVPISAAMGTPLYFNTELFVPIADGLRGAGVGTGPIVALTIAGAGANLPEFVMLSKLARRRLLATFVGYVFLVAVSGGLLTATLAG